MKLPVCGNGEVEGRELCDDGNLEPGDGCDENCLMESRELCDNRLDDDGDGSADCADPDCFFNPICAGNEVCTNGFDDDGDGDVDCDDSDCLDSPECVGEEICGNDHDDDNDGLVDCEDNDCNGHPFCGGCDPDLDFGVLAVNDSRVLTVDTAESQSVIGVTCGAGSIFYHLRFEVEEGFHLRLSAAPVAGELVLGLLKEEEPGITCMTDELLCLAVDLNPTQRELTSLAPGAYRLVIAPVTDGESGQLQLSLLLLPGAQELCENGSDDDGDGLVDCDDPDCDGTPACIFELCDNGLDDDGDGLADCDDPDCAAQPPCLPPETCGNGLDDDGDGLVDCADVDCAGTAACVGSDCVVNDNLGLLERGDVVVGLFDTNLATDDNDCSCGGDGPEVVFAFELQTFANVVVSLEQSGDHVLALSGEAGPGTWCDSAEMACVDPGGSGRSARTTYVGLPAARYFLMVDAVSGDRTGIGSIEVAVFDPLVELCDDGLDDDGDGLVDCDDPDCAADPICVPESACHDDLDNDADGQVDCADFDCVGTVACGPGACVADRDLGAVVAGAPGLITVDTSTAADLYSASCARGGGGGDVVVAFSLPVGGDLVINAQQLNFSDHAVALMCRAGPGSGCDAAEHACTDGGSPGLPIATVISGVPAGDYYLLVEPYGPGGEGGITLELEVQ
ncbi:MAG: hypothetical protein ABI333_17665 [bacterium]